MKNENAKNENAKTENAKPRRVKMNYKVSELAHVFLNGAAPEGARAGEYASAGNGVLWHERALPAAAHISDAQAADGRPVVVIMPQGYPSRWCNTELLRAVPDTRHAVALQRWNPGRAGLDNGATCCSAAALVEQYSAAIEYDALRSVHSAGDVEGVRPDNLPHYAAAINELLALRWADAIAQERARVAWHALRARWQLSSAGAFDINVLRAIAQQQLIEKNARAALPTLQNYFSQRAGRSKTFERAALLRSGPLEKLQRAIADVLRAGLPAAVLHGLPANMAGTLADDAETSQRINRLHEAPQLLARAWQQAMHGNASLPDYYRELPERWRVRFDEARAHGNKRRLRNQDKQFLHSMNSSAAVLNNEWPLLLAYCEQHAAGTFNFENADACNDFKMIRNNLNAAVVDMSTGKLQRVREITHGHAELLRTPAIEWADNETRAARKVPVDELSNAIAAHENAREWAGKIANMREQLDAAACLIASTPRAAYRALQDLQSNADGWGWRYCPEQERRELLDRARVLMNQARLQQESISELAEWEAGGLPPRSAPGDWLLINGSRARTTRGAEVSTRAVRLAFAVLDAETETAVCFRERQLMIGAFQLTQRSADGTVHIGCHAFTAAAVEHARQQLAKIAADKAQESGEVAA